tara:strand:+ start:954 stop:1643 length:690 start_codon:yes stop_codon:yes gene_type:complete
MTQPSNPLIRIAEQDTTLPVAGGINKIEPVNLLKTVGFDKGNKAFAQNMNYIFDNLADWIAYSQERLDNLETQIEKERVSVGEIIEISGDNTNPSVLKGYGTWESFGAGQVLVGVGSHTDDRSESKTWTDGDSEGEYKHVQTINEIAKHKHTVTIGDDTHTHEITTNADSNTTGAGISASRDTATIQNAPNKVSAYTHNHTATVGDSGSSTPMNNIQPSLAVYRWKRTA